MPIFRSLDLERMLIYQEIFLWKSAILHSIKLPFDVQAAEKILHVIYYLAEEHCINILILTYINAYHAISSTLSQVHNTQWGKSIFEISF